MAKVTCVPHGGHYCHFRHEYVPPKSTEYDLRLTVHEAAALFHLLNTVGGHPNNTPRQYTNRVQRALNAVGVPYVQIPFRPESRALWYRPDTLQDFNDQVEENYES